MMTQWSWLLSLTSEQFAVFSCHPVCLTSKKVMPKIVPATRYDPWLRPNEKAEEVSRVKLGWANTMQCKRVITYPAKLDNFRVVVSWHCTYMVKEYLNFNLNALYSSIQQLTRVSGLILVCYKVKSALFSGLCFW